MALKKYSSYYEDRQLDQLSALAELEGRDVSKILRTLADDFIERNAHRLRLRRSFGGGALMKRLGGEVGEATVIFFGVQGFARTTEGWAPEEVGAFLNALYQEVGEISLAHGGRVVKFMGDGGLLLFEGEDHPVRAAQASFDLVGCSAGLTTKVRRPVAVGVGAASGPMLIGHFGHAQFFQFDVVGDTVNLGFGMHQLAGDGIVVNEAMRDALGTLAARERYSFEEAGTTAVPGLGGRLGYRMRRPD